MGSSSSPVIDYKEFCEFATKNGFKPDPPTPTPFDKWDSTKAKYAAFKQANSSPHFNIRDRQEAAMFFAHVLQESGFYQFLKEKNPPADAYKGKFKTETETETKTKTKTETETETETKPQYYGRGYIQLSWKGNYEAASVDLNLYHQDVVKTSDALVKDPCSIVKSELLAWHTALWFWTTQVKKSKVQCTISHYRFGETTNIVNSIECKNPLNAKTPKEKDEFLKGNKKAQQRFEYYKKNLEVLGITAKPIEGGCYN